MTHGKFSLLSTLVAAATVSGCMAHVPLPQAPPREAPYPVRVQTYNTFRPLQLQYTTTVSYGRYGVTGVNTAATGLVLANGANVFHPEDLVPMAGLGSPTDMAARESANANHTADILTWSGIGGSVLGATLMTVGLLQLFNRSGSDAAIPLMVGGGVLSLGGSITVLVGSGFRGAANRHRETAYQVYDQSLRGNLGLCGDGTQIGDCPTAPGAAPAQPQTGQVMQPVQVPPPPPN